MDRELCCNKKLEGHDKDKTGKPQTSKCNPLMNSQNGRKTSRYLLVAGHAGEQKNRPGPQSGQAEWFAQRPENLLKLVKSHPFKQASLLL